MTSVHLPPSWVESRGTTAVWLIMLFSLPGLIPSCFSFEKPLRLCLCERGVDTGCVLEQTQNGYFTLPEGVQGKIRIRVKESLISSVSQRERERETFACRAEQKMQHKYRFWHAYICVCGALWGLLEFSRLFLHSEGRDTQTDLKERVVTKADRHLTHAFWKELSVCAGISSLDSSFNKGNRN